MRRGTRGQRIEVIASFKHRHNTPFGMDAGDLQQPVRHPGEIFLHQIDGGKRIPLVAIETRGQEEKLGTKRVESGDHAVLDGRAEGIASGTRRKRGIDDIVPAARLAGRPGPRKVGILMGRCVEHPRAVPEHGLGAVAVMDVEIDDRNPFEAVGIAGVGSTHRDGIEEAEAHRTGFLGVVARWPDGAEGVAGAAVNDRVHGIDESAGSAQGSFAGTVRDHRVGIDMKEAIRWDGAEHRLDIALGVHQGEPVPSHRWRHDAVERREFPLIEGLQDPCQSGCPFGMMRSGIMIEKRLMRVEACRHATLTLPDPNMIPNMPDLKSPCLSKRPAGQAPRRAIMPPHLSHLRRLEAKSIHIMREVVAESRRPAMLHLALKAFHPSGPPYPLLHVDTTWKFPEMYAFRDRTARELKMELPVHVDRQGLDAHGFDAAFGGARRDEERSRATERVFSFRSATHQWDPRNRRPELWSLYNTRSGTGKSIRVFPLSNRTEFDIRHYINMEGIEIVPLCLAVLRPVVEMRRVRFRTPGCWPLTGAIESSPDTVPAVIREMLASRTFERMGRLIDRDQSGSMERMKREGYF